MREHPHLTLLRARVRGPPGPQAKEEVERPNAKSHHRFGSRFERVCRPSSGTRQARVAPARNANEPLGTVKRHGGSGTVPLSTRSVVALFSSATDKGFKLPGIPAPSLQTPRARIDHGRVCALCVTEAVDEAGYRLEAIRKCDYCPVVVHERCATTEWADPKRDGRRCCHACTEHLDDLNLRRDQAFSIARKEYRRSLANEMIIRCAKSWLSHRTFHTWRKSIIKAQSVLRMALYSFRFWRERIASLRNIQLLLYDITVKGPPLPANTGLFGVCTVLDDKQHVLFAFDLPEVQLKLADEEKFRRPEVREQRFGPPTNADMKEEIRDARRELAKAHARRRDPHHSNVATYDKLEHVLPGASFDVTVVYTVFLKTRKGSKEVSQVLGQGAYTLTPSDLARCCDGRLKDAITIIPFNHRLQYALRDQSQAEMKALARKCYRNYAGGEIKVAIRGLNGFANLCGFLEGPYVDTLVYDGGDAKQAAQQNICFQSWWATLANGVLGFYFHRGDAHARVSVNATKCKVTHRLHKGYHAFSVELPDRRVWPLAPSNPLDAERWVWALEYWRLRSAHGKAAALAKVVAPKRRRRQRSTDSVASSDCSSFPTPAATPRPLPVVAVLAAAAALSGGGK